ncbi:armadillo-like helical domain-containing protein [Cavenderia fasciculata]|uniref:Armadillo-like helical domain-containing protein n=1 Tax=Cavenderia fasciculata TaxID=261658 RepID=F4PUD1_CACFS|nr:armadillo-like helical domain-containing protein [Cavenderia fasciculata]EGG21846.1 armadillo-like helical domain-containing protein [Cavenderia fasciculata]|eukprot:XP_004359697.1 armadillo-like helical domain-containing protein [Cavenderia fasciculata]
MHTFIIIPLVSLSILIDIDVMESQFKRKEYDNQQQQDDSQLLKKYSKLLEEADEADFEELNPTTLKKMVLSFEKKFSTNQDQRSKFNNQPEKFMQSEIELDEEIKKLQIIATAPELYPLLVKLGTVVSLGSLLDHENVDITIDAIDLFNELVQQEQEAEEKVLIHGLLENGVLIGFVQALSSRLQTANPDHKQAIESALAIIEMSIDAIPTDVSQSLIEHSNIFQYFFSVIKSKDAPLSLRLNCSELLSIILQDNEKGRYVFGKKDGIDNLLIIISQFKKKSPESLEETEMIENLFTSLYSCLFDQSNKNIFLKSEGIELMLLIIKNKTTLRGSALKVLDYELNNHKESNQKFVDALGLKTLFSSLMKKLKQKHQSKKEYKKIYNQDQDEEHIIIILQSLFSQLDKNRLERLLSKFTENNGEKIDRLFELFEKYNNKVKNAEDKIKKEILNRDEDDDEDIDEDEILLQRMDAGLFKLQNICLIISHLYGQQDKMFKEKIENIAKKDGKRLSLDIINVLNGITTTFPKFNHHPPKCFESMIYFYHNPKVRIVIIHYYQFMSPTSSTLASTTIATIPTLSLRER